MTTEAEQPDELSALLDEIVGDVVRLVNPSQLKRELATAILALIAEREVGARISELEHLEAHCDPLVLDKVYINRRITRLSGKATQ